MAIRTPLERVRLGALVLVAIVVVAVLVYRLIGGYGWVESVWMVVVTISSVGYGERSILAPGLQLFTVAVIVFGISAAAYTFGGFIQAVFEGEIERVMGRQRMTRDIDKLKDHVIICGYGRIGQLVASELRRETRNFVVIENDPQRAEEASANKLLCLVGDATEEHALLDAGLLRAHTLVTGLPSDAANVFITLTARNLNPSIQIVARAEHKTSERKLRQAGAQKVVMPAIIGAQQMVRMITRPSTADLMELVAESSILEVELDELTVAATSKLVNVTVAETEAHRRHRLLVVAVKQPDAKLVLNPDADYRFQCGDIVIIMGRRDDIQRFRDEFRL